MSVVKRTVSCPPAGSQIQDFLELDLPQPKLRVPPIRLVQLCYAMVHAADAVGIHDLADGEFRPTDTTLEHGINRQLNYLLDEVGCNRPGFRLLEIGCGYGSLLKQAKQRGAIGVGVNLSPEQVKACRNNGFQVYLCNYRDLLDAKEWHGQFDGVVANGSLEHWVQPEDVLAGKMNAIYSESFEIVCNMLDPKITDAKYVTTAIHVKRDVRPEHLLTPWHEHPKGSDRRHYSLLHNWMGGYYPVAGQLEECAKPYFSLETEMDGTLGYKIANDFRMARMMRGWYTNPRMVWRILRSFFQHKREAKVMFQCYFVEKAWDWQFRGEYPPMQLLRHTWKRNQPAIASPGNLI